MSRSVQVESLSKWGDDAVPTTPPGVNGFRSLSSESEASALLFRYCVILKEK